MSVHLDALETQRLQEQSHLDAGKEQSVRNRLGQFATPTLLAREIAKYVWALWKLRTDKIRFLDPAVGTGSFYSALLNVIPRHLIECASGIEIDKLFADTSRRLWEASGLDVREADFTKLKPPLPDQRFNLILTNPPYVRHHHLSRDDKLRLKEVSGSILRKDINGLAGLYCYFMILSHSWLAENGMGVWLIPSEFMDVNYGASLKNYLTKMVTLLHIHRFDPKDAQFDDALVSSAVVVFQNVLPFEGHQAKFSYGGSISNPNRQSFIPIEKLKRERKWSGLTDECNMKKTVENIHINNSTLSSLFSIKRGIATGGNDFFIMPKSKALGMGIDECFLKPILPSPRYLHDPVIESDSRGCPIIEKQLAIIDSDLPEDQIREVCKPLWIYLQFGKDKGFDKTYLATSRTPWYRQEQRQPAPILCTYMGRAAKNGKPFRFILNRSRAVAANVYLLLYPIGPLKKALDDGAISIDNVFDFLQEIKTSSLVGEGRVYGGGLYKMEPAELGRVPADNIIAAFNLKIERPAIQQSFSMF